VVECERSRPRIPDQGAQIENMLTVLLATRNRADLLRELLGTYLSLQVPSSGWKLVVVDNGSTDQTTQVIDSFANRLPLQSVFEPRLGKNHALNTGLGLVDGDLVVLTDDDAFPHPDWLIQLRKAADTHPAYSIFGGAIVPRWEAPSPLWVRWLDLGPIFTLTDTWLKEGPLPPALISVVQGPNMAIRTSLFHAGTRFDTSIGPRGSDYPMGSETELVLRLSRQGHKAWHVQGAVVEHFIRETQLSKEWVLQRAIRLGRGRQRMSPNVKLWMGVPRHLVRDIPKEGLIMAAAWVSFRQDALLRSRWRFNILRGKAIEAHTLSRERRAEAQPAAEVVRRRS
jgi:L-malate glycosyltransferase